MSGVQVKSIPHWLERTFPSFPAHFIHLAEANRPLNQTELNPYTSQVILLYRLVEGDRFAIVGFIWYGGFDVQKTPPLCPVCPLTPIQVKPEDLLVRLDSKEPSLARSWLYALMGLAQPTESIPIEFLEALGAPLPRRIEPELADLQNHFPRPGPPKYWFDVDLAELPNGLAKKMILWPGGRVHVSSDDVWEWVRVNYPLPKGEGGMVDPRLELMWVMERQKRKQEEAKAKLQTKSETFARLAPCMLKLYQSPRFPKDMERQYFVRSLRPHVSLEVVGEILDEKNDSSTPTLRRWDYEAHYNKGYAPPSCEKLNACGLCPMGTSGSELSSKKDACFRLFLQRFESRPNPKSFYGPVKWFEW